MIKKCLQSLIVKTDQGPMAWAYRVCYALAIQWIVRDLKKQPDIIAVYLMSGMVTNECVPGLSDIDLMIIVKDLEGSKERVRSCCARLCRLIPLLKLGEQSVYDVNEIRRCYVQSDFYLKYKFLVEYKQRGKLLCGMDVLRDIEELDSTQSQESIIGHLGFVWAIFLNNFLIKDRINDSLTKNYICYKITADSCRAFIAAKESQVIFDRKKALKQLESHFDPTSDAHIKRILDLEKKRFFGDFSSMIEDTYDFCVNTIHNAVLALPEIKEDACGEKEALNDKAYRFESIDYIVTDINETRIEAFVQLIEEKYASYVASVLVSPPDLLHLEEENMGVFIIPKKHIPLSILREFIEVLKLSQPSLQNLYLYLIKDEVVFCLNGPEYCWINLIFFPIRLMYPTFLYLGTSHAVRFGKPLDIKSSKKIVTDYFKVNFQKMLLDDQSIVRKLIHDHQVSRLSNIQFHLFFWQAIRLKLVEVSMRDGKIFIPLTSRQVCQCIDDNTKFDIPWLKEFHHEYKKDLAGIHSDSEFYFSRAISFLKELHSEGFSHHYHIQ